MAHSLHLQTDFGRTKTGKKDVDGVKNIRYVDVCFPSGCKREAGRPARLIRRTIRRNTDVGR